MTGSAAVTDPEYIEFLLDPEDHNYYFWVGNEQLAPLEKLGVVRKMLAAHSEVFKTHIRYGRQKTEEPEHISDLFPSTFKNLLRFVYGHDTTSSMDFDDADDLFYAANKYMMPKLKNKLATRLMQLVDYSNICILLNNPACYEDLELKSEISKILQSQTDRVLASPQFFNCCPEAFVKILEEEILNVREVDIWKSAVEWAKSKVSSNHGGLRKQLEKPLEHIRVCSIPYRDLWESVVFLRILSHEEVLAIQKADNTSQNPQTLPGLCTIMETRKPYVVKSKEISAMLKYDFQPAGSTLEGCFTLETKEKIVEITVLAIAMAPSRHLCSILCRTTMCNPKCCITLLIEEVGSPNPPTRLTCVNCGGEGGWLMVPVSQEGQELLFWPKTKYKITVCSDQGFRQYKWFHPSKWLTDFTMGFPIQEGHESTQGESATDHRVNDLRPQGGPSSRHEGEPRQQESSSQQEGESRQQESSSQQEGESRQQESSSQQEGESRQQESQSVPQEKIAYLCPVGYIFYKTITSSPLPGRSESLPLARVFA